MSGAGAIPSGAVVAIEDMLDFGDVKADQEVLILAQIDGLYGGDNLVDEQAIGWIQTMVQRRGANASILWIDEPARLHQWRIPPVVKGALRGCDVVINHSFDLVVEEMLEFRKLMHDEGFIMIRNFATTAPLLSTPWAQTPSELLSEIRYQASLPIKVGSSWQLFDEQGSHLEGVIAPSSNPVYPSVTLRRKEAGEYRPWPEWLFPPIDIAQTSGVFIFDRMLSWWTRYIGIPPYFKKPIRLTIENCRIKAIEGGPEAAALKQFLHHMAGRLGDGVWNFTGLHCGVHPHAKVDAQQCASESYRRVIEHCHSSNLHVHIGAPEPPKDYFYWMHCTGDTQTATWRVGDALILDKGQSHNIEVRRSGPSRPSIRDGRECERKRIGSDFLMDGGVTAA